MQNIIRMFKDLWILQILNSVIVQNLWSILKKKRKPFDETDFRNDLSAYGDSLLVISDEEIAKIHIHSETAR